MRKYIVLFVSILIQSCLGGIYAWSAFAAPLQENYGFSMGRIQLIFGFCIASFTLTMVLAGRLQDRFGPRIVSAIGGILFGGGFVLASFSKGEFVQLFLGIGIVSGAGIGCTYVCPIAACIRWFPECKGFATGMAVAGFGGGAILLANIAGVCLERGTNSLTIFYWAGVVYLAVIVLASLLLFTPATTGENRKIPGIAIVKLLRRRDYWLLTMGLFAGTFAGLMSVSNLKVIGQAGGVSERLALLAISLFAIGNASGRIVWGFISDAIKEKSIPASLLFSSASVLVLIPLSHYGWAFVFASFFVGFGFGSNFVVYAADVARTFGEDKVGTIYPMVFLLYGVSGPLGPATGGWLYDLTRSYTLPLSISVLLTGFAAVLIIVKRDKKDIAKDSDN